MTSAELTRALGCNRSTVTRYLARGMPSDSLDAAQRWIALHVRRGGPARGSRKPDPATAAQVKAQRELLADYRRILAECQAVRKIVKGMGP